MKRILLVLTIMTSISLYAQKNEKPIKTGRITDTRDNEVYETVTIGNQRWMAENLRYNAKGSLLNPKNPSNKYGRLYNWKTVMNGASSSDTSPSGVQGICPSGWHVPSEKEWQTLEQSLGMSRANGWGYRGSDEGTKMKSTSGWSKNGNGSNASGFNVFPAGYHYAGFTFLGGSAYFWTSSENPHDDSQAWHRILRKDKATVNRIFNSKNAAYSCRCVEN